MQFFLLQWLPTDSKVKFSNSDSEVTSNRFWRFVLKEGSENSTDSLIELLSESVTSKEEYSSIFLLSLQWVFLQSKDKYSPWNLSWSCCFDDPVKVLVNYGSTVRWFDSAIQIPWRSVVSWETSVQWPVSTVAGDVIVLRRFVISVPHSKYCISELIFFIKRLYWYSVYWNWLIPV